MIIKILKIAIISIILIIIGVMIYLTIKEFKPKGIESLSNDGNSKAEKRVHKNLRLVTYNIGYSGLGQDEDFFYDGGKKIRPKDRKTVETYLNGTKKSLLDMKNVDFYLLQETDRDSKRSYYIDEYESIGKNFSNYSRVFATNYKVDLIPFPLPFMGKIHSGLAVYSKFSIEDSKRYSLPGVYSWPKRVAYLKRAMIISCFPIENNDKKLVVINTHCEAYDKGGNMRTKQMEFLKKVVLEEYKKGNYVIVGGDWNQTFPGVDVNKFSNGNQIPSWLIKMDENWISNDWNWAFDENTPTVRSLDAKYDENKNFFTVIDGFLVSPNISVKNVKGINLGFKYSDHNPVLIDIELK